MKSCSINLIQHGTTSVEIGQVQQIQRDQVKHTFSKLNIKSSSQTFPKCRSSSST
jgi:hypothetical protein